MFEVLCRHSLKNWDWITKGNSKIPGTYLSSKLALPFFPFQHLQSKERRVCCESSATVRNLGKKAQRKEYLLKKRGFLSKRVWNVQPLAKASCQHRSLWVGQTITFFLLCLWWCLIWGKSMQSCSTKDWNTAQMQRAGHAEGYCNKALTAEARLLPVNQTIRFATA